MMRLPALALMLLLAVPAHALQLTDPEIALMQEQMAGMPLGERIALWAERFVGTPYDPDPLGEYVRQEVIVADERVDCMYLTFRSVELALSASPGEAAALALEKRFRTEGAVKDGRVLNYEERFEYAVDMLRSGKWGADITAGFSGTVDIRGSRGVDSVRVLPREAIAENSDALRSGDVIFFVKDPARRVVGEIVGHIGFIKREGRDLYLIHASGSKGRGGEVRKVSFEDYVGSMPFVGIMVGRF